MTRRVAFVTGFPGFIARRLVGKLLMADEGLEVVALVEPRFEAQAQKTVENLHHASTSDLSLSERLRVVLGDVTSMDLGLSGPEFQQITHETTEVYHLAAVRALGAERRKAEAVNVQGTMNLLALARAMTRLGRLVHFSSAYVSGARVGVIMEDELEEGQSFRNTYESTKHRSEVLVQRAMDRLPITIVRPAGVVGDSRTGEIDHFDSVYHLGMLLAASPVALPVPLGDEGRAPLYIVPVDYLVDVVHAVVSQPETLSKTFHVVDPNPLSVRRVYTTIAERAGRKLPRYSVPTNLTKALLRIPGMERFASISHEAVDYLNHMAIYNSRNTAAALEGTGLVCPPFETYVENLMRYVRDYFDQAGRWRDGTEGPGSN